MSEGSGPTPEELGITPEQINTIRMIDVEKATDYATKGIKPEDYYEKRWNETILLSDELSEDQRIQWTKPQLIVMGGMPRSGKSTVGTTIEREFNIEGIPCIYLASDITRNKLKEKIEAELLSEGFVRGTDEFANEREARLYSPENRQKVYDQLYAEAGNFMRETGGIAIVDATHITEKSRTQAYESIKSAYGATADGTPPVTYLEVSNSLDHALDIFKKDQERIEMLRKGYEVEMQSPEKPKPAHYLPFDVSEAHPGIRKRDEARYEPILTKHIKVVNGYKSADELINHVKRDLFAKKPENIDTLWDTDSVEYKHEK